MTNTYNYIARGAIGARGPQGISSGLQGERGPIGARGPQGVQGIPGRDGSPTVLTLFTGEAIGGHRAVGIKDQKVYYADNSDINSVYNAIGISKGASDINSSVEVQIAGIISFNGWNWNLGVPIFLGTSGQLTQTAPTIGYLQIVGYPTSTTDMIIQINNVVLLG